MCRKPFHDDSGNPQLKKSLCLFADVLGYSATIRSAIATDGGVTEFQRFIRAVPQNIRDVFTPQWFEQDNPTWLAKVLTDNVVVGHELWSQHGENEIGGLIVSATAYQAAMANDGYLVRGGLASGLLFMDDVTAWGPALLDAYEIESTVADVPRIVLSSAVVRASERHVQFYSSPSESPQNAFLIRDVDGHVFLNYLYCYAVNSMDEFALQVDMIAKHRDLIEHSIRNQGLPSKVKAKYRWLASYHNYYFSIYRDDGAFSEDLLVSSDFAGHTFKAFGGRLAVDG